MHQAMIESLENRTYLTMTLDTIGAQEYPGGKALFVPVTGTTDGTAAASFSVSTSSGQVMASMMTNVTFLQMDISIGGVAQGSMEFALFGSIAPHTVANITGLVNSGYYNGLTFHRVIQGFMAQGGAGAAVADMDDEFNPLAIFDRPGLLAMANANSETSCDTGSSQFFVTVAPERHLDFRHTIFGMLVRGQGVLDQIMAVGALPDSNTDAPSSPVVITSAGMVQDKAAGVVVLEGRSNANATITVNATDANSTASQAFAVTAVTDTTNDPPFLGPVGPQLTVAGVPVVLTPTATDIDAGTSIVSAAIYSDSAANLTMTQSNGVITFTPTAGFTGTAYALVAVYQGLYPVLKNNVYQNLPTWDTQTIEIKVQPAARAAYNSTTHRLSITGTTGNDVVSLTTVGTALRVTINGVNSDFGASAIGSILVDLSKGDDRLTISPLLNNVTVYGGAGNDAITGGAGSEEIHGGDGNDLIYGMDGSDLLYGEAGADSIYAGFGADTILAGDGNDSCAGGRAVDVIRGGAGLDTISGDKGNDRIYGEGDADLVQGGDGNDVIFGGGGDDRLYDVAGSNTIFGGNGNDQVYGGYDDDVILGEAGNDTIRGGAGNDTLYGGAGNDSLSGEDGDDWLYAFDTYQDTVSGGLGVDHAKYNTGTPTDVLIDVIEDVLA